MHGIASEIAQVHYTAGRVLDPWSYLTGDHCIIVPQPVLATLLQGLSKLDGSPRRPRGRRKEGEGGGGGQKKLVIK